MRNDCFCMKLRVAWIFEFYLIVFEYVSMLFTLSTLVKLQTMIVYNIHLYTSIFIYIYVYIYIYIYIHINICNIYNYHVYVDVYIYVYHIYIYINIYIYIYSIAWYSILQVQFFVCDNIQLYIWYRCNM